MNRATFVDRFFDASFISFWEGVLGATPSQRGVIRISDEPNVLWRILFIGEIVVQRGYLFAKLSIGNS